MIEIKPVKKVNAVFEAPPSKAHTLRALFIAALAKGESHLLKPLLAEDQMIAIEALQQFGAKFEVKDDLVIIQGTGGELSLPEKEVFVGNSGVTARFMVSLAALCPEGKVIITGTDRMKERPVKSLLGALRMLGVRVESANKDDHFPLAVFGKTFDGGETTLKGSVSSQYFSSILLSAPYAKNDVIVQAESEVKSKPYIDITLDIMKNFGVEAKNKNYSLFSVKAGKLYRGKRYKVEGE